MGIPATPPTQPPLGPPSPSPANQKARRRRKPTQGAYCAICAVNRQPWYAQRRGWAQVRTPKNPLRRVPRQPPEEHLGAAPPQVRRTLGLRQGAISNENAALAGRRARFQGIGFFKASGGKVGGRKHTLSATNLREFGHRSRRDPPEASMFVLRRRGFSTRKLSSDPCDTPHPTTPWATQPQPSQPESEQKRRKPTQGAYGAICAGN